MKQACFTRATPSAAAALLPPRLAQAVEPAGPGPSTAAAEASMRAGAGAGAGVPTQRSRHTLLNLVLHDNGSCFHFGFSHQLPVWIFNSR